MRDFKLWLASVGRPFPAPRRYLAPWFTEFWFARTYWAWRYNAGVLLSAGDIKRLLAYQVILASNVGAGARGGSSWEKQTAYNDWEAQLRIINERASTLGIPGVQAFQSCNDWLLMQTEVLAVSGIAVAVSVSASFGILSVYLFIGSLKVAAISVTAMTGIVTFTFGMLAAMGGSLGIIEAVTVSMLLGLSVDYVIHMAESYVTNGLSELGHTKEEHHAAPTRQIRAASALTHMGSTVLHSAATTSLACSILVFAYSRILRQVGMIICMNIISGCVVSLLFYTALLSLAGPEDMDKFNTQTHLAIRVALGMAFLVVLVTVFSTVSL
eukprot:TRINITY_DN40702_c0_g1_i1.p1 TRINITY_DN40702_c0_g1~~TRINITY_DN40702_c0_g1_i1.p1  ORF type:complete len:326 (+),score=55.87 TRINITY_DN40702_c0_g1_i1:204-1181(+)